MEMPARQRFGKYRGLKSWRTSSWDPKEALPRHYARIFALQNPRRTHNRCAKLPWWSLGTGVAITGLAFGRKASVLPLEEGQLLPMALSRHSTPTPAA